MLGLPCNNSRGGKPMTNRTFRMVAMRLRLSDAASLSFLAEHYSAQAEMCHQMARMTVSPFKEVWLDLAAEWTKLARETEEKAALERR